MSPFLLVAPLLLTSQPAAGAPSPQAETDLGEEVVVTAYSKPYKLNGKQLATAQKVFAKHRPRTSPQARLLFQVKPRAGVGNLSSLRLALRSGARSIPIELDDRSRFVLPPQPKGDWRLFANRGSRAIEIIPIILSPGSTEGDRRLGDLRLECEVLWAAFVKPSMPFALRGLAAAVPLCRSSKVPVYVGVNRPLAGASIVVGSKVRPVQLSASRRAWRYPGYDKSLPNSARVRFRYE